MSRARRKGGKSRRKSSYDKVLVRVMWHDWRNRAEAEKIARIIEEALRSHGYKFTVGYADNKRDTGGRIYIHIK